ncbi:MAG: hypothetical protein IT285_06895 [Bdellovibrionales bacterium]|nr:hypothetical protein [Bdellovibrionales bacterium]
MKLTRVAENIRVQERATAGRVVQERPEKEGFQQFAQDRQQDDASPDSKKDRREPSREEVEDAIQHFATERLARERGFQADLVGSGPGLRVVLKDGTGAVVRQFTGDEFVKLRESVAAGPSGALLDRKL